VFLAQHPALNRMLFPLPLEDGFPFVYLHICQCLALKRRCYNCSIFVFGKFLSAPLSGFTARLRFYPNKLFFFRTDLFRILLLSLFAFIIRSSVGDSTTNLYPSPVLTLSITTVFILSYPYFQFRTRPTLLIPPPFLLLGLIFPSRDDATDHFL